jgi:beta-xylosidase
MNELTDSAAFRNAMARSFSRRRFLQWAGCAGAGAITSPLFAQSTNTPSATSTNDASATPLPPPQLQAGPFKLIYDPTVGEEQRWYINDHTFVRASEGQWHLFGITHAEPAAPGDERMFAHATAPDLLGPWIKQPPVMKYDPSVGETHVWAPYVFAFDGKYWMYYCGGGPKHEASSIQLATSTDLSNWERSAANPMLTDGFDARDPMVLKVGDQWILYYCANSAPEGGNHTVKAVTSKDLVHWSNPQEVFRDPLVGRGGGPTESPFVVERNGKYYLFVCTNYHYNQTAVHVSDSPFHWDYAPPVGLFPAHAAEVAQNTDGKWYISRAGWGQGGVYLAELTWMS